MMQVRQRLWRAAVRGAARRSGAADRAAHDRMCTPESGLPLPQCSVCRSEIELELADTYLTAMRYPFLRGVARLVRITYRRSAYAGGGA